MVCIYSVNLDAGNKVTVFSYFVYDNMNTLNIFIYRDSSSDSNSTVVLDDPPQVSSDPVLLELDLPGAIVHRYGLQHHSQDFVFQCYNNSIIYINVMSIVHLQCWRSY